MSDLTAHALKNNGHRCSCNTPLVFERRGETFLCHCERCDRRAKTIPGVVAVDGYGSDPDLAFADWLDRQNSM